METLHSQLRRAALHSAPRTRPGWPRTRLLWWSSGSSSEWLLTWWFRSKPNPLDPRNGAKIIRFTALKLSQKENFSVFASNLENFHSSPEPRHPPASACKYHSVSKSRWLLLLMLFPHLSQQNTLWFLAVGSNPLSDCQLYIQRLFSSFIV